MILCPRGGGNIENLELSQYGYPLRWMLHEAMDCGLRMTLQRRDWKRFRPQNSMNSFYRALEYLPLTHRSYDQSPALSKIRSWYISSGIMSKLQNITDIIYRTPHLSRPRQITENQFIHESVFLYMAASDKRSFNAFLVKYVLNYPLSDYKPKAFLPKQEKWPETGQELMSRKNTAEENASAKQVDQLLKNLVQSYPSGKTRLDIYYNEEDVPGQFLSNVSFF
jgi:hypothetical protein